MHTCTHTRTPNLAPARTHTHTYSLTLVLVLPSSLTPVVGNFYYFFVDFFLFYNSILFFQFVFLFCPSSSSSSSSFPPITLVKGDSILDGHYIHTLTSQMYIISYDSSLPVIKGSVFIGIAVTIIFIVL